MAMVMLARFTSEGWLKHSACPDELVPREGIAFFVRKGGSGGGCGRAVEQR